MSGIRGRTGYPVECCWPGVTEEKVAVTAGRIRTAADEVRLRRHDVRFVGSIIVAVDETLLWLFDGDEADVRAVSEQAGIPDERVLESARIDSGEVNGGPPVTPRKDAART